MSRSNWDRTVKNGVRTIATRKISSVARNALMVPGRQLKCIKEAMKNNLIKKNETHLYLVEKDYRVAKIIADRLKSMGWEKDYYSIYNCKFHLLELPKNMKIDYAFLDLCGPIDGNIARWLHDNQDKFYAYARIGMTFCAHVRVGRQFTDEINDVLPITQKNSFMQILAQSDPNWLFETFGLINGNRNSTRKSQLCAWNGMKEIMQATWSSIYCALNKFNVSVTNSIKYKEPGPAIMMHYIEIKLSGSSKGTAQKRFDFISDLATEIVRPSRNMKEAGRKAAETRRKNKQKRIAAGRKAAKTRARNRKAA